MNRIPFLDAARGTLACVIVLCHVAHISTGTDALRGPASWAVLCFFAMSGYVLTRGYNGAPIAFLGKRIVRLWPLYAVCLTIGHLQLGNLPALGEYAWWPALPPHVAPDYDPPVWSLYLEAWATPLFPVMFRVAALRNRVWILLAVLASGGLILIDARAFCIPFFVLGAAMTRFEIRWPQRVPGALVWLGDVSYSLYLTHWLVIMAAVAIAGPVAAVIVLPLTVVVAWLAFEGIERPSIRLSRLVGKRKVLSPV